MKTKIFAIWVCAMLLFSGAVVMMGNDIAAAKAVTLISGSGVVQPQPLAVGDVTITIEDSQGNPIINRSSTFTFNTTSMAIQASVNDGGDNDTDGSVNGVIVISQAHMTSLQIGAVNGDAWQYAIVTANGHMPYNLLGAMMPAAYTTGGENAGTTANRLAIEIFSESFNGPWSGGAPIGWSKNFVAGATNWVQYNGGLYETPLNLGIYTNDPTTPNYNALFYQEDWSGPETMLWTPKLNLSGALYPTLDFWVSSIEWAGDYDRLSVWYNNTDGGAWQGPLVTITPENLPYTAGTQEHQQWTKYTLSLPDPTADYHIGFRGYAYYGYGICLDDVSVYEAFSNFSGSGSGTVANPYVITNVNELQEMSLDPGANYTLGNDIDASATSGWNGGEGFEPVGSTATPFTGTLDGQGYSISNLFIDRPTTNEVALFGYTGTGSLIAEVELDNVDITGQDSVGSLIGNCYGYVTMCYMNSGSVFGVDGVGGLIAYVNPAGAVNFSYSAGTVVGTNRVGGLIGHLASTCNYSASEATVIGDTRVGGLVGIAGDISDCYATGNVTANTNAGGGLAGEIWSPMFNVYSTGAVNGSGNIGGLVGTNPASSGSVTNGYWDTLASGMPTSTGGAGRTTTQMMQQTTFVGWDFTNIWDIKETFTYPFFIWDQFNSAVIAQDDEFTTNEDSILSGNVTHDNGFGPDVDPDGGPLTVTEMNGNAGAISMSTMIPSGAWVTLQPNGTFTYIPAWANQDLQVGEWVHDSFTYTVRDANMTEDTATVMVNVTGLNDAPVMANAGDTVIFNEKGLGVIIDPDITVTDVDNADLAGAWVNITGNYQVAKDILEFTDTGGISGTYASGNLHLTGVDTVANYVAALRSVKFNNSAPNPTTATRTITWFVTDGLLWGMTTSSVMVNDVNDNPIAANDTGNTDEDTAFNTIDVTLNDTDPELDVLSVSGFDDTGTMGLVTDNGDNTFNYDPNGQFEYLGNGEMAYDFFNYTVSDGNGGTDTAMVTITITGINDAPILDPIGNRAVDEEVLLTFTVTASDPENDQLSFTLEPGFPAGASIHGDSGEFTWTPTEAQGPGFYNITIRVTDNGTPNLFDNETIMITVGEVNQAPVLGAIGDRVVDELNLLTFTATATDADIPANTLSYSLDPGAPAGANINPISGLFTWTPTEAQGPGTYSVTIRVTDDGGLDDFETIQITVGEVNVAPVLGALSDRTVDELTLLTFTATATDADLPANVLTFSLEAGAPVGAAITAGGVFTWTPTEAQGPGVYNITVRVTDADGLFDNGTFMVTVNEVNAAPVANDNAFTVNEDSGANALDVLANDLDPDIPANTLTIIAVTQGAHGTVVITGGGTGLTYAPNADFFGTDSFTYTITDGNGENATATVTITVLNVNDDPTAVDDAITINEDSGPVSIPVLANDYFAPDIDETLTITAVTQGAHGTVVITGGGTGLTYRPDDNYHGTDTFTYTISDGNGGTATATVTVTVTPVNDPPVITNSDVTTAIDGDEYSVAYSATDVDGDALTWHLETNAAWLSMDPATGLLNGTAVAGTYNVQITVSDGTVSVVRFFKLTVTHRDSDGDGVPDYLDDFPDDPNEWKDTDGDGIGDNSDPDIDGDGVPNEEDAFPYDPTEWKDTDGDGIGDNTDPDIDGDGVPNEEDPEPLNPAVTGNEYDPGWPYWGILIVIAVMFIIGLAGLAVFRFLIWRP